MLFFPSNTGGVIPRFSSARKIRLILPIDNRLTRRYVVIPPHSPIHLINPPGSGLTRNLDLRPIDHQMVPVFSDACSVSECNGRVAPAVRGCFLTEGGGARFFVLYASLSSFFFFSWKEYLSGNTYQRLGLGLGKMRTVSLEPMTCYYRTPILPTMPL